MRRATGAALIMVAVFGDNMYAHEFLHDARHLLGFPCH